MRLATFRDGAGARLGALRGKDEIVDLAGVAALSGEGQAPDELRDMLTLIDGGPSALQRVSTLLAAVPSQLVLPLSTVELLAPIPRPRKNIFCLGRNYAEHAAESLRAVGQEVQLPAYPNVFTKAVTTVAGPHAGIPHDPRVTDELDWEVELGVVIGRSGRHL